MTTVHRENGIDVEQLRGIVDAIRRDPAAGRIGVRMRHRWDDGFAVDGQGETLDQGGEAGERTHHTLRTDWPKPWGGDSGPTPGAESLMAAVGACVATTYVAAAALRRVPLDEVEVEVEGNVDLAGLFQLAPERAAFENVALTVRVHSSADDAALEELGRTAAGSSPVFQSITSPVPIALSVERL